jgi:hypothetical protein
VKVSEIEVGGVYEGKSGKQRKVLRLYHSGIGVRCLECEEVGRGFVKYVVEEFADWAVRRVDTPEEQPCPS